MVKYIKEISTVCSELYKGDHLYCKLYKETTYMVKSIISDNYIKR